MISFEFPAEYKNLDKLVSRIKDNASVYSDAFATEIELASSEAITNIIKHAYHGNQGSVHVEIRLDEDGMVLSFIDQGTPFDLSEIPEPNYDLIQESGYGISIIRQIMDEYSYEPDTSQGNRLRLKKNFQGA